MHKFLFLTLFTFLFSQAEITNIQASQRTDGSQIVDITYDLLEDEIFEFFEITAFVSLDGGDTWPIMTNVSGDLGQIIVPGIGKTLFWDFGQQFGGTYSNQIKIKIKGTSNAIVDDGNYQELPFEMVTIPSGEYTFGENNEIKTIEYDYEIMKYEVTDLDYVLFMLDKFDNSNNQECEDYDGFCADWNAECDLTCADIENNAIIDDDLEYYCSLGNGFNNGYDACCFCGGGSTNPLDIFYIYQDSAVGYYPGDGNTPAGNYEYINFSNSKISWNGEIFEVQEGNVNHPVIGVTWFGAWAFATHYGMTIPDQYEWEKAARGNTGFDYPWGNDITMFNANYNAASYMLWDLGYLSTPVGTFNGDAYSCDQNNIFNNVNQNFTKTKHNSRLDNENISHQCYNCDLSTNPIKSTFDNNLNNQNRSFITYEVIFDWGCTGEPSSAPLTLFFDGTADLAGSPGTWTINEGPINPNYGFCDVFFNLDNDLTYMFDNYNTTYTWDLSGNLCSDGSGYHDDLGYNGGNNVDGITTLTYIDGTLGNSCDGECTDLITIDSSSPYGIYDMAGNVWEMIKNTTDDNLYIKGGGYFSSPEQLKSFSQELYNQTFSDADVGFRCMRIIDQSQSLNSSDKKHKHLFPKANNKFSNSKK